MQQSSKDSSEGKPEEPFVVIYEPETLEEAAIVRGLLQSAGIESPLPTFTDPFPLPAYSEITHGTEVLVRVSQADDARQILKTYAESSGQRSSDA
jgi:hypothetical protein